MRISWFLLGVGGISAVAAGSTFQTIIKQGDPLPGGGTFDPLDASIYQVSVADGGKVAINASTDESGVVFYYNGSGFSSVIQSGNSVSGNSLDFFDNLAISGNGSGGTRLTFVGAQNLPTNKYGIYQFDIGSSVQQVAFDGTGGLSLNADSISGSLGTVPLQVNATGQVAFTADDGSGNLKVMQGNLNAPLTTLFTSAPGSFTLDNSGDRIGIDTNGAGEAALTNSSGVRAVYTVAGGTPVNDSGGFSQTGGVNPPELLAVAHGSGVSASLFTIADAGNVNNQDLVLHDGTGDHTLYTPGVSDSGPAVAAEMTPGGQIAYFKPSATGGSLQYYKIASGLQPTDLQTQVAAAGQTGFFDPATPAVSYTIEDLQTVGGMFNPLINSSGLIVFDGDVSTDGGATEHQALLDWKPGDLQPTIVLQVGDAVPGVPSATVEQIITDYGISNEGDILKDSLSDDGSLAVSVYYDGGNGEAVLLTNLSPAELPEPASISLLSLAGAGLLRRRRRTK